MASIIIPAHNEEAVIGATLAALLSGLDPDTVEIIVVCNGCTDDTVAVAKRVGWPVQVAEIDHRSKTAALNEGDSIATTYPRIYLDADIEIGGTSIARLVELLKKPGVNAAEPVVRIDVDGSSLPVRAYYAVWVALHGQQPGDIGGGIYAMTHQGRRRFGEFPDVISDDAYVKAHFAPDEILRADDSVSVVYAPARVAGLLRIKTRSRLGLMELRRGFPELWSGKRSTTRSLVEKAGALPLRVWPCVPVYVVIQMVARRKAAKLYEDLDTYSWQRDETSRNRR